MPEAEIHDDIAVATPPAGTVPLSPEGLPAPKSAEDDNSKDTSPVFKWNEAEPDEAPEAAKVPDKKDEVAEVKKPEEKPKPKPKQPFMGSDEHKTRDYSFVEEGDRESLANIDNKAYEWLKGHIPDLTAKAKKAEELEREVSQLRATSKGGVYDHPEGYVLSDSYKGSAREFQQAYFTEQHYLQQMDNVDQGQTVTLIEGFDEAGNPKYSQPYDSSGNPSAVKNRLQAMMHQAGLSRISSQRAMEHAKATHQQAFNSQLQAMNAEMAKRWSWVRDPSKLDEKVAGYGTRKEIGNQFFSNLPPNFHRFMPTIIAANMYIQMMEQKAAHEKLTEELTNAKNQEKRLQAVDRSPSSKGALSKPQADEKSVAWSSIDV